MKTSEKSSAPRIDWAGLGRKGLVLTAGLGFSLSAFAVDLEGGEAQYSVDGTAGLLKWVLGCLVVIIALLAYMAIISTAKEPGKIVQNFLASFVGSNEKDEMLDHAYDGIQELDNRMPAWLRVLFYGTIAFAFVYLLHFHVLGTGTLQIGEYEAEVAEAKVKFKDVELPEDKIVLLTDGSAMTSGQSIFVTNCASCHREDGGGQVGPNLTDPYWIHGGSIKDVYSTITNGVPEKGMISWRNQLTSMQRLEVASYVMSMQGSSPADPKEPEGELFDPESAAASEPAADDAPAADDSEVDGEDAEGDASADSAEPAADAETDGEEAAEGVE